MSYRLSATSHSWEKGRMMFQIPAPRKPYSAMSRSFASRLLASSNQTSWTVPEASV